VALWCQHLRTVTVARGAAAKAVTLVVPYYESPEFFARQLVHWETLVPAAAQAGAPLSVIVVDDGSPRHPASASPRPWLRLFRIEPDIPWNWLAARNIGAHHAAAGWLLLTDMDHLVPAETLEALITGAHDPALVYALSRQEHTGEAIHPHSASFFMTRAMFWQVGGYDERLSGVYGTDGLYRRRLAATAPIQILSDVLVRHEYVGDSSVTSYERKTPAMRDAKARRLATLSAGPPLVLSFPYHEVTS
jgi:hypothetical protein